MHINVRDFLAESVGYSRAFTITGERPDLDAVKLAGTIEGEITIARLDEGLLVRGRITASLELECHRCLCTFIRPFHITLSQLFTEHPKDDELAITDGIIDLAPMIEQELVLNLPIKILHDPDCPGIQDAPERYNKEDGGRPLHVQARITKGTKRGRP